MQALVKQYERPPATWSRRQARAALAAASHAIASAGLHSPRLERLVVRWAVSMEGGRALEPLGRRVRLSLLERLAARGDTLRDVEVHGIRFRYLIDHFTGFPPFFSLPLYEPLTSRRLIERLQPGDTFVDVGANAGYFAVLAAKLVGPAGRVFAFEPNPASRERLTRNIAANTLDESVTISSFALSDADDHVLPLFLSLVLGNDGMASLAPAPALVMDGAYAESAHVMVQTRKLDSVLSTTSLATLSLIKIDVEGHEARVLGGMSDTLDRFPGAAIICETRPGDAAYAALLARGYSCEPLDMWAGDFGNYLFSRSGT